MTSAHTGSDIQKGFQYLADRQGYPCFRGLLADHVERWVARYPRPDYNEREPIISEKTPRKQKDRPRSSRRQRSATNQSVSGTLDSETDLSDNEVTDDLTLTDTPANTITSQPLPRPSTIPSSPPQLSDPHFGSGDSMPPSPESFPLPAETLPLPSVPSESHLLSPPLSTEAVASPSSALDREIGHQNATDPQSAVSTIPPRLTDEDLGAFEDETVPTLREFIGMLLRARQYGHDVASNHDWTFRELNSLLHRCSPMFDGRRLKGIQMQKFIPTEKLNPSNNHFCIYGCTKDGIPDGIREWLGCWSYQTPLYFNLANGAVLLWLTIGRIARMTIGGGNRAIIPPLFSQPWWPDSTLQSQSTIWIPLFYITGTTPESRYSSLLRQPWRENCDPRLTALFLLGRSLCSLGVERFNDPQCCEWQNIEDRVKPKPSKPIRKYQRWLCRTEAVTSETF